MFDNLSIRSKLWGLVALASIASAAIVGAGLWLNYQRMHADRVQSLRFMVEAAHSMAAAYEAEAAAGRITREEAQARFKRSLLGMRYGGQEYLFAITLDGFGFAHPSPKMMGQDVSGVKDTKGAPILMDMARIAKGSGEGTYGYFWNVAPNSDETAAKLSYIKTFQPWGIYIGTGVFIDDIRGAFLGTLWTVLAVAGLLAVPAVGLIALVGVRLSATIRSLSVRMHALADGDLSVAFPEATRRDEIGAMASAARVFLSNAEEKKRLEADQAAALRRSEEDKRRTLAGLAERFERSVGEVMKSVSHETEAMEREAQEMTRAAGQTDRLAGAVASATEQTSANVQTVAVATEQLSGSVGEISRRVADASRIARDAATASERATGKVTGLAEAVGRIGTVVSLINDIAAQTNLLALNATIEAARAGEAGKGFAVVAGEVKSLASQTARATEEIATQVAGVQSATGEAVAEIGGVARVIEQVNGIATIIASAVEEQGAATQAISRNVQQAADVTRDVARDISGVTAAAGQCGKMAYAVLEASRQLAQQSETLNGEIGGFLRTLRTQ
ncbi:HAMP domain-containing protein [Azospirillum brasilense]|uniref:HAMP domain-containing protein n=1 Tax=Azospirillum brasilense TaxID=192 RepID=A0A4D8RFP1_AZOBR|nr:cache domain-containing protein [Azospirillum brasilense]QCO16162.1 HAMP domain-containing protein [Azospirillum brasilense]